MMAVKFRHFIANDSGATAIEYGLIAALIGIGAIASFTIFGGSLQGLFSHVDSKTGAAIGNASGNL